jgi:hypothetical protein
VAKYDPKAKAVRDMFAANVADLLRREYPEATVKETGAGCPIVRVTLGADTFNLTITRNRPLW